MGDLQQPVEQLVAKLLELDASQREACLDEIGRRSPSDRARIERLLLERGRTGTPVNHSNPGPGEIPTQLPPPFFRDHQPIPPADTYLPQFGPGEVIASRFVVTRFISRGGMGEVYEVEDRQLRGVHVALKTILSHFAQDPAMRERFKREVLTAREISHPHVCPVHEFFEWEREDGTLLFLTMKLLRGESLFERLTRSGRLPEAELTAITRQAGSGLAAAHTAGVLHRDIKSANILLDGSGDGVHAWITDFGLARPTVQANTALTVHGVVGTPGYLAPELLYGEPPSQSSDVFAFGVVVYEMLTGKLPRGSISDPACKKELESAEISAPWRRMVECCLRPAPEQRCKDVASALQMVPGLAASSGAPVTPTTGHTAVKMISRRRMLVLAGAAAGTASAAAWMKRDWLVNIFSPLPGKRFVALMAWPANEYSAFASTLLDQIGARLIRVESLVGNFVVFGSSDLAYGHAPVQTPQDAEKILGATLALAASLRPVQGFYELDLQLVNLANANKLRERVLKFESLEITSIERMASETVTRMLGLPRQEKPLPETEELSKISPAVQEIFSEARQFAEKPNGTGLDAAIGLYQKAVDRNPQFGLGYAELAITYIKQFLRNGEHANVDLARNNAALALRYNPLSAKSLLSHALVELYSGDSGAALGAFSKALLTDPANAEILVYQAQAYRFLNQYEAAQAVYERIISERPNYWLAYNELGYLLSAAGKHEKAAEAFRKAIAAAPTVALPETNLASEYLYLNRSKEAMEACQRSIAKDPSFTAYRTLGDLDFMSGKYTAAKTDYQNAARLNPNDHDTWRDIGDCDAVLGNAAGVRENYERAARALQAVMPPNTTNSYLWSTLAFYLAKTGERAEAEAALKKAGTAPAGNLRVQLMMIQALTLLGRREEALTRLLAATDRGLSALDVDASLDLKELSKDPRYLAKLKAKKDKPVS